MGASGAAVIPPSMHPLRGGAGRGCGLRGGPCPLQAEGRASLEGKEAGCLWRDPDFCTVALRRWDEVNPGWGPPLCPAEYRLCLSFQDLLIFLSS